MHFGALVPQGWKHELDGMPADAAWQTMIDGAKTIERLGLDSLWIYDHFHPVPPESPPGSPVFECWTSLAAIATATSTVRLGQMVTCTPYRNAGLLAKVAATVDVASGGRLELGLGAGWYWEEYNSYGYGFPEPKERLGYLRDTVNIVKRMWTDEKATYEGRYASVANALCDPKPLQKPRPPVWIGGGGEQVTLRITARHADWANLMGPPETFAHKAGVLAKHCEDVGRDPSEVKLSWHAGEALIAQSEKELDALCAEHPSIFGRSEDERRPGNLIGTVQQCVDKIGALEEAGNEGVIVWFADYPRTDSLELFATEVRKAFS